MLIRAASTALAAGLVTTLLAASPISPDGTLSRATAAQKAGEPQASKANASKAQASTAPGLPTVAGTPGLAPRKLIRKLPSEAIQLPVDAASGRPQWNGKLAVKFRDEYRIRADRMPSETVRDSAGQPVAVVTDVLRAVGGSMRQMLRRTPEELRALEMRAERLSQTAQPDLASMTYVDVQPGRLLEAARAFNNLDIVEWVEIERTPVLDGGGNNQAQQDGCGANGPGDGTGITNCYTTSPDSRCSTLGGGQGCNDVQGCQAPDGSLPSCRYGCNNTQCCETVGEILPGCNDQEQGQGWDALCATYANILCTSTVYDSSPAVQGGGGSAPSVPQLYKYDPCFAMRGPIDPNETDVLVYGAVEPVPPLPDPTDPNIPPALLTNVPGQLLTYATDALTGAFVPGSLVRVFYPGGVSGDEGDPSTDVPQQALPDPSLEGAYLSASAGCFAEHTFGGCNQVSCCVFVCRLDPSCCVIEWDADCVTLAEDSPPGTVFGKPCTTQELPVGSFPPGGPTPLLTAARRAFVGNARGYQNYTLGEAVVGPFDTLPAGVVYPVPAPTDNVAVTPDPLRTNTSSNLGTLAVINSGYRGGGLDLQGYDTLITQLGINPNTRCHGQNTEVAVVEFSAYVNHEDLAGEITPEPNQTQVLVISDPLNPNHGTAVLGIIGAARNDFGVTGIAYGAALSFYPTVSVEEGSRLENALTNALIDLEEGDVINMSIGYGGGNTIVTSQTVFTLVSVGTAAGITSVCSAGNDASPVVTSPDGEGDSGAIIVGACWPGYQVGQLTDQISIPGPFPGNNYCRLNFSNFTDLEDNNGTVDVAAWGTGVTSIGYGDLFNGDNSSPDPLQVNKLRSYTSQFNGTSAAAPIISGWCSRLQSFSIAWFGTPLPPATLRQVVSTNVYQQCGISYASPAFPGYPENGSPAVGDIIPGGQQARIGGFPRARNTVSAIVASTLGGTPILFDVITGSLEGGSSFSVRQLDGIYLRVGATRRRAGSAGQGLGTPLYYPITGGTTDLQLKVTVSQPPSEVTAAGLAAQSRASWNLPVVEIVYFYNFPQKRWIAAGSAILSGGANAGGTFTPPGILQDYIIGNSSGGTDIYARVYTCGLSSTSYSVLHDLLNLQMAIDIFDAGGGGVGP